MEVRTSAQESRKVPNGDVGAWTNRKLKANGFERKSGLRGQDLRRGRKDVRQ